MAKKVNVERTLRIAFGLDFDWLAERKWGLKFEWPLNLTVELYFVRIDIGLAIRQVEDVE